MKALLKELDACQEAVDWAGNYTIEEIVKYCHRGDWLLWLAIEIKIDVKPLTLARGHCANTVRHLMKDERSIKSVDVAIAFGEGRATLDELKDAADAARAAAYATDAAYAATAAAAAARAAAAYAPYVASCAANAAYASCAADAAARAAAYATDAAYARKENQMQTADICRKYLGQLIIDKCNELNKKI